MQIIRKSNHKETINCNREGEVEYLTFPLLSETGLVDHLFTTRLGGVSGGMFSSMNLSYTRGDEKEVVDENFRRIAGILHRSTSDFVLTDQTHTTNVRKVTAEDAGKGLTKARDYANVDGCITNVPGLVLSTFYADCVPLYFVDPIQRAIGLSHSGWKGTVHKMAAVTIEAMGAHYGSRPRDIFAAIGPSICQACYEVGEEVIGAFQAAFPEPSRLNQLCYQKENGKYQLDLWEANKMLLLDAGILEDYLAVTDICTCCNPDYLFSHRASKGKRGNLGAFLSIRRN